MHNYANKDRHLRSIIVVIFIKKEITRFNFLQAGNNKQMSLAELMNEFKVIYLKYIRNHKT